MHLHLDAQLRFELLFKIRCILLEMIHSAAVAAAAVAATCLFLIGQHRF